jgi:RNA polymerase sigma-70 factor, ECF subfamily
MSPGRSAGLVFETEMSTATENLTTRERELLTAARRGDEDAFRHLVEPRRPELHAHCYRMLGSVHDAEDALQESMLRAWRGLSGFEGRSSLRSWLYRIATNTSLNVIEKRPKRVLPIDYGPATDPHDGPGRPVVESVWVEPYPDERLGLEDGFAAPEARYEQREAVELAFIAALQHLPATQRAVLILREVLGFSAREVAETLETTTASVNSALQRARKAVDERLPEQSQQATMRALGDEGMRQAPSWYQGHAELTAFLGVGPLSGEWRWRHVFIHTSGQPTLAFYSWDEAEETYLPFALNVLTIRGGLISDVTAYIARSTESSDPETYRRWPEEPIVPEKFVDYFERFGLPARLD